MCAICVAAQDATPPTGEGAAADAWEKTRHIILAKPSNRRVAYVG